MVLLVCVLAGCGGSSSPPASVSAGTSNGAPVGTATQYKYALEFARCMRSHGVPDFPDPRDPGGFSQAAMSRLDVAAPAYGDAFNQCDPILPNAGQPTPVESAATLIKAVKVAKCMRAHGVNMPDPNLQPNGQLEFSMANVNANAPDFNKVGDLCEKKVYGYS